LAFAGGEFPTRLTLDLLLGWALGIVFQHSTIAPMRGLSFNKGLLQAIRADTLAIIAFEIGTFCLDDARSLRVLSPSASSGHRSGFLVHDADWHDCRIFHVISGQHLSSQDWLEGKNALYQGETARPSFPAWNQCCHNM
jgi:Domain of unknown function (DUF4396)